MARRYAFRGQEKIGTYIKETLEKKGYLLEENLEDADLIFTYCTSQTALEDAYYDSDGIMQLAHEGAVLIDLSPATPQFAKELNALSQINDFNQVSAPVILDSAFDHDALSADGYITCFMGGDEKACDAARPVLEELVSHIELMPTAAEAALAKAVYTLQLSAQVVATIEADALYRACSERSLGTSAAGQVGAVSPLAQNVLAAIHDEKFESTYTVEICMAELVAAITAADDADLILPHAEAAMHILELLAIVGGIDLSPLAMSLLYGDEEACERHGLDWSRAQEAYGSDSDGSSAAMPHLHNHDDEDFDDFDSYDDSDYADGMGGYSEN